MKLSTTTALRAAAEVAGVRRIEEIAHAQAAGVLWAKLRSAWPD